MTQYPVATETQVEATSSFDFDDWKSKGEAAYAALGLQIKGLKSELADAEEKHAYMGRILGRQVEAKPEAKPTGSREGRVRIRPLIVEALMVAGKRLNEDQVIEAVQERQPKAGAPSIRVSLERVVRMNPHVHEDVDTKTFFYRRDESVGEAIGSSSEDEDEEEAGSVRAMSATTPAAEVQARA